MREIQSDAAATARSSIVAAICWILAGVVYLLAEAVTAAAFSHYSYAFNYISDLGVPDVEMLGNRPIDSPLHLVMNVAFVLQGLLFATAALFAARSLRLPLRPWIISFAFSHTLGMVMIAVVNGGQHNNDLGLGWIHLLGALFAFLGGHLTMIFLGTSLFLARCRRIGVITIVVGLLGVLGIIMLQVDVRAVPGTLLPDGVWERIGMYALVAWEVFFGAVLLLGRCRHSTLSQEPATALD